ncbi:hypothetical protein B0H13DRAFT_1853125 [Mycena leptocephala]|nr:hypothetical protein B0H13DRAFT_1853125 [Mycena leptocephala]
MAPKIWDSRGHLSRPPQVDECKAVSIGPSLPLVKDQNRICHWEGDQKPLNGSNGCAQAFTAFLRDFNRSMVMFSETMCITQTPSHRVDRRRRPLTVRFLNPSQNRHVAVRVDYSVVQGRGGNSLCSPALVPIAPRSSNHDVQFCGAGEWVYVGGSMGWGTHMAGRALLLVMMAAMGQFGGRGIARMSGPEWDFNQSGFKYRIRERLVPGK